MSFVAFGFEGKTRAWRVISANQWWIPLAVYGHTEASFFSGIILALPGSAPLLVPLRSLGSWFSVVTSGGGGSRGVIDRLRVTP
ncbi:hypothetical protein Bca101_062462 [Brassica carinata]